jgi:hypothetical protein
MPWTRPPVCEAWRGTSWTQRHRWPSPAARSWRAYAGPGPACSATWPCWHSAACSPALPPRRACRPWACRGSMGGACARRRSAVSTPWRGGSLPERAHDACGRLACTSGLGGALVRHKGGRPPRHHGTPGRMEQRRASPLRRRGAGPVAVALGQTRGPGPRLGGNVRRARACHAIVVIEPCHRCQGCAALEVPTDALEHRAEGGGQERSTSRPPPRSPRHPGDAVAGLPSARGARCRQGEPGRCREGNQGTRGPQRRGARHLHMARAGIGPRGPAAVQHAQARIGRERCACCGSNDRPATPPHQTVPRVLRGAYWCRDVDEKPTGRARWLLGVPSLRKLLEALPVVATTMQAVFLLWSPPLPIFENFLDVHYWRSTLSATYVTPEITPSH